MRVTNRHTAVVCGIAPGDEGDVDANNRGVRGLFAAGFLVPLEAAPAPAARDDAAALQARFDAAWTEREAAFAAELAEVRMVRDEAEARAQARDAEIAQLRAELDEATRPAAPSPPAPGDTPKPARTRKEG